jgi:hypothetical protein
MKIIKFNESLSKEEIDDLLLDLRDSGYEVESDIYGGFVNITGKIIEPDRIQFMRDIIELNNRMISIGYEYLNDNFFIFMTKENGNLYCKFRLKFKDKEVSTNKDVNSFEEFKEYVEKVLDLKFYEWDTEVYIPDLEGNQEYRRTSPLLKLDVNKTPSTSGNIPAGFTIGFEKGTLDDFISTYKKELSQIVMTNDEWSAVNLWSVRDDKKSEYQDTELVKRAKSKQFKFDKKGIEVIEKCVEIFRALRPR